MLRKKRCKINVHIIERERFQRVQTKGSRFDRIGRGVPRKGEGIC